MKKLLICVVFGLLLYGCSEVNGPTQVNEPARVMKERSVSPVITNQNSTNQLVIIKPFIDSVRSKFCADSVIPPNLSLNQPDSVIPPNLINSTPGKPSK
jgi:hypothetical protein